MSIDTPDDRPVDIARQALDDAQWHRATNEGWPHPPACAAEPPSPPERLAPRMALEPPGLIVQMAAWRERAATKRRTGGGRARPQRR
ncbi:hypothetical protein [Cognatilysobacter segetis]|uniref:hypothetical protein n=1 Tax=Cognatilysobacter segetis TaxID=2492394 RepID=UPI00105B461C|nr:hypothetical protein [Lysobacter segetis]